MEYERRLSKVMELGKELVKNKSELVSHAVRNLMFTFEDCSKEVDITVERLKMFEEAEGLLKNRKPLGGPGSRVSLMLSYNGSAWLNTAITSIYIVGNKVSVKFSSRASDVMKFTEAIYRPIFGDEITFYRGSGRSFIEGSVKDELVSSVVVFGSDENILPYEETFRKCGKKLVFEGPGQDPFIVLEDADMDSAVSDLMQAKFMYSGQTCTAPKRIFIQNSVYEQFLEMFSEKVRRLVVGDPAEKSTDVSPLASGLAVERIRKQLEDAGKRGGITAVGGKIEGNMVFPTVVKYATDDMLGMKEEVFGPVAFTSGFGTADEVIRRARNNKYGLRAAVFGKKMAGRISESLKGEEYCHPVEDYKFGRFGSVSVNQSRADSWKGAFVVKPVGGYGYSGWIWENFNGNFRIKQGPKLLSLETAAC